MSTHVSFNELSTVLNAEEESLNDGFEIKDTIFAMVATATPKPNNNGFNQSFNRGRDRGHSNNRGGRGATGSNGLSQFSPFNQFQQVQSNSNGAKSERPICQICGKVDHLALDCYHRMDYAYQGKNPPTKLATMATALNACLTQDQPWLADSAAIDHVTSSLSHHSFPKPYQGQDHTTAGNGQNLPATHLGNASISFLHSTLHLNNVLKVSRPKPVLQKLEHDRHVNIKFISILTRTNLIRKCLSRICFLNSCLFSYIKTIIYKKMMKTLNFISFELCKITTWLKLQVFV